MKISELAQFHNWLGLTPKGRSLLPVIKRQSAYIREAYSPINEYYYETEDVIPAAEWYLDNYYIISELITGLTKDISKEYESKLQYLKGGDNAGYPRIYLIIAEFLKQCEHELNFDQLKAFIAGYQEEAPLSSAEIWAVPMMLKVLLLEKVYYQVERILYIQAERRKADDWLKTVFEGYTDAEMPASEMPPASGQDPEDVLTAIFMERIARKLKEHGLEAKILYNWLDNAASRQNTTVEKAVNSEHHFLTAQGAAMGKLVTDIKQINAENWSAFFENVSLVQQTLQKDPAKIFDKMDFDSRDKYRHEIEGLAGKYKVTEIIVARTLEKLAAQNQSAPFNHVGYYLFGSGKVRLEKELADSWGRVKKSFHGIYCYLKLKPALSYLGLIFLATLIPFLIFLDLTKNNSGNVLSGSMLLGLIGALILINGMAVCLINRLFCRMLSPNFLPKLYLDNGIPEQYKTIVVIPAIFNHPSKVRQQMKQLETHYLSNRDQNLCFAVLGDFADAPAAKQTGDDEIIQAGVKAAARLNDKYGEERFFYFHRERKWNEKDKLWMGWERKRGKLIEFNRLLLNEGETSYFIRTGKLEAMQGIRYVITLDADTILPRDSARKLIGTIAHPMNEARLADNGKSIAYGYGIIQPRIGLTAASAFASPFARVFTGTAGIDPYTCAISDIYQDLFGEGIFTGKGIYDLKVFHAVTQNAFPDNRILSHDLIEGLYARTALATDIEFFDGYPTKFLSHTKRAHRWIRGDWQIARYMFQQDFSAVSRWKIFDNLRRSLETPFQIIILFLAVTALHQFFSQLAILVLLSLSLPLLLNIGGRLIDRSITFRIFKFELKLGISQILFSIAVLPYQAYNQLDAVFRSLGRQIITKRKLLEWETAADSETYLQLDPWTFYHRMVRGIVMSLFFLFGYFYVSLLTGIILTILLISWLVSPWLAYRMSLPYTDSITKISSEDRRVLRMFSRQVWAYFDLFVNTENNYLPPDNIQMEPHKGEACRTSPTNIGLALLANLTAGDLGYVSTERMLSRIRNTLRTIQGMPKWNGHIYNWYDTQTLEPLHPIYISTVDSGNMAGYMIALKNGLAEISGKPLIAQNMLQGFMDTYLLSQENAGTVDPDVRESFGTELKAIMASERAEKVGACAGITDLQTCYAFVDKWAKLTRNRFRNSADQNGNTAEKPETDLRLITKDFWPEALARMLQDQKNALEYFFPFLTLPNLPDSLRKLGQYPVKSLIREYLGLLNNPETTGKELQPYLYRGLKRAVLTLLRAGKLQKDLHHLVYRMNFKPLFDDQIKLFTIGYNLTERKRDKSYYDLLASEARQTSLLAIAKGDVPQSHWFKMARPLTRINGRRCLVSWSGTMFEFLMPSILFKNYRGTLLDESYRSVVKIQQAHAEKAKMPWGISESGFFCFDIQNNYQYKAFGVPGLGLKRGLSKDMVISPYSTFMALPIDFKASMENLHLMKNKGYNGVFGLFEAIDYTKSRVPYNAESSIVKSYMSHHQGMSLIALGNVLEANRMQERFHREPVIKSIEMLLQEQVPLKEYTFNPIIEETGEKEVRAISCKLGEKPVVYLSPNTRVPRCSFISNREYAVMLTLSGTGYSQYNHLFLTRWRKDPAMDRYGTFFYVQNLNSGNLWSATAKPVQTQPEEYKVTCFPNTVKYIRKDGNIITQTDVFVAPEDPVEIRKITLTNQSSYSRDLQLTSYVEVALDEISADMAHPAFSKLFIQTKYENNTLVAFRRPRHLHNAEHYMMHTLFSEGNMFGETEYETDRVKFIGRGRTLADPRVMDINQPLSNSVGAVLDPILSLRARVRIDPGRTVSVYFLTGYGNKLESVLQLAQKYRSGYVITQAKELAWSQNLMELTNLQLSFGEANMISSLAGQVIYGCPIQKSPAASNQLGQTSLWSHGISGDLPVVMLKIQDSSQLKLVDQILTIHEYWKIKGLYIDLVIFNEDETGYFQAIQEVIMEKISISHVRKLVNKPGGVFLLKKDQLSAEDGVLLHTVASVIFSGENGSLNHQIMKCLRAGEKIIDEPAASEQTSGERITIEQITGNRITNGRLEKDSLLVQNVSKTHRTVLESKKTEGLKFFNGYGGFTDNGKEYVIINEENQPTPLPWVNVIANEKFGTIISEAGASYTWSQNSREYKLSPWSNDPLLDVSGEAVFIKDEDSQDYWSPLPQPVRDSQPYLIRHGQGYTVFEHSSFGINQETRVFIPLGQNLKITALRLTNKNTLPKRLSLYYYLEWVLGVNREQNMPYLLTELHDKTIFCQNVYQEEFAGRAAFITGFGADYLSSTSDRIEFLGVGGSLTKPKGILSCLSGKMGTNIDPCAVLQLQVTLDPGEEKTVYFLLGDEQNREKALSLVQAFRSPDRIEEAFQDVSHYWDDVLSRIQISTPEPSFDLLVNRWLLYQTIVCRIWARSGFYQTGGAYGYRDQLQDVMPLAVIKPEITRKQIILHSSRQFPEGDVQHWWHSETGKGIRTKFSDDLLWLPYVTADYLEHTEDFSILEEKTSFLKLEALGENEDERYAVPETSEQGGSVYEHCVRAIDRSLRFGGHGLPLIGTGDWNDGFSAIGREGNGESVWLGWFILAVLKRFIPICARKDDNERVEKYTGILDELQVNMEKHGWDGSWYRRAYYDDGSPVGSITNSECQIDAIAQSWSILSGSALKSRAADAMLAVERYLWDKEAALLKLLTPPFDKTDKNPGYIKAYIPGVRENGGQYTHAAAWAILAFSKLGSRDKAMELFQMLNPVNHARTGIEVSQYKAEPYVIAADVYAVQPNVGRGGWTWYTGAAGWMYQAALEGILGLQIAGDKLSLTPCVPSNWESYSLTYRHKNSTYQITVNCRQPAGAETGESMTFTKIKVDDKVQDHFPIALSDDGKNHVIEISL
ncbi:glucoamylase family protein [Dehalobacter sp. TBBPA1]|uniref:GH36-type glycosyl hydrolase domain-containing protein n=1 Tax=Dehalobacter sp. TBBPA1 TaxID=3235037 RepID=UPI0034A2C527